MVVEMAAKEAETSSYVSSNVNSMQCDPEFSSSQFNSAGLRSEKQRRLLVEQVVAVHQGPVVIDWNHVLKDLQLEKKRRIARDEQQYSNRSCFVLDSSSRVREWLIKLVEWPWFDRMIIILILANCIFLVLDDPVCNCGRTCTQQELYRRELFSTWDCSYWGSVQDLLDKSEVVFTVLFTAELLIKVVARGFILHKHAFLRDSWNWIDFIVVVTSLISQLPGFQGNVQVLRTIRVLRPLRTMTRIKGMRPLINTFLRSFQALGNVVMLLFFFFVVYGILGVELLAGRLRGRCFIDPKNNDFTDDAVYSRLISQQIPFIATSGRSIGSWNAGENICGGSAGCDEIWLDGTLYNTTCSKKKWCGDDWCTDDWVENPYDIGAGFLSYDNIGSAFLMIFQSLTVEGWVDIMYMYQDGWQIWGARIYQTSWVLAGTFFVVQLALAVLSNSFVQAQDEEKTHRAMEAMDEQSVLRQNTQTTKSSRGFLNMKSVNQLASQDSENSSFFKTYGMKVLQSKQSFHTKMKPLLQSRIVHIVRHSWKELRHVCRICVHSRYFQNLIIFAILLNTLCLGLDSHSQDLFENSMCVRRCELDPSIAAEDSDKCSGPLFNRTFTWDGAGGGMRVEQNRSFCFITTTPRLPLSQTCAGLASAEDCWASAANCFWFDGEDQPCRHGLYDPDTFGKLSGGNSSQGIYPASIADKDLSLRHLCGDSLTQCPAFPKTLNSVLEYINIVLTFLFMVEMLLKMLGLGLFDYFEDRFNQFDFFVVTASIIELSITGVGTGNGGSNLSALRGMRLFRLFKLARSWNSMRKILQTLGIALGSLGPLTLVWVIFMYIFALLGMQYFGGEFKYVKTDLPRSNFDSFFPSSNGHGAFFVTFQIITTENWNTVMYNSIMASNNPLAALLTISIVIFGNYIIMNLFISILLQGFGEDDQDEEASDPLTPRVKKGKLAAGIRKLLGKGHTLGSIAPEPVPGQESPAKQLIKGSLRKQIEMEASMGSPSIHSPPRTLAPPPGGAPPGSSSDMPGLESPGQARASLVHGLASPSPMARQSSGKMPALGHGSARVAPAPPEVGAGVGTTDQADLDPKMSFKRSLTESTHGTSPKPPREEGEEEEGEEELGEVGEDVTKEDPQGDAFDIKDAFKLDGAMNNLPAVSADAESEIPNHNSCYVFSPRNVFRRTCGKLVYHRYFDHFILACILVSSITLILENPDDAIKAHHCPRAPERLDCTGLQAGQTEKINCPMYVTDDGWKLWGPCGSSDSPSCCGTQAKMDALKGLDIAFTIIFLMEMMLKLFADGVVFHPRAYFRSTWNWLDCAIVVISLINVFGDSSGSLKTLKSLRAVRALRPLRVIKRNKGLKIAVISLLSSIPSMLNVGVVCLLWFSMYAMLGVQFFKGELYRCYDLENQLFYGTAFFPLGNTFLSQSQPMSGPTAVPTIVECVTRTRGLGTWNDKEWSFNSYPQALLTLFEMSTTEGWLDVMAAICDTVGVGVTPLPNINPWYAIYCVCHIVVGAFVLLNLIVGAIINNYTRIKNQNDGIAPYMTPEQQKWIDTQRLIGKLRPQRRQVGPESKFRGMMFNIASSQRFEIAVTVAIILNILTMMTKTYNQSDCFSAGVFWVNLIFTVIFVAEAAIKLTGLGPRWYFRDGWNDFDFIVAFLSTIIIGLDIANGEYSCLKSGQGGVPEIPALQILRAFRIARVFRLIRRAKGLRIMIQTLIISLPALWNIGVLIALFIIIFAVLGTTAFYNTNLDQGIYGRMDEQGSYVTFDTALWVLFRQTTGESWNGIMYWTSRSDLYLGCDKRYGDYLGDGCGGPVSGVGFHVFWQLFGTYVMMQLFTAIILENFDDVARDEDKTLPTEKLDEFVRVWTKFDPHGDEYIPSSMLPDLIKELSPPLGVKSKLVSTSDLLQVIKDLAIPIGRAKGGDFASVGAKGFEEGVVRYRDTFLACAKRVMLKDDDEPMVQLPEDEDGGALFHSMQFQQFSNKQIHGRFATVAEDYAARLVQRAYHEWRERKIQAKKAVNITRHIPMHGSCEAVISW